MFNLLFSRFMSYLRTNIQQTQKFILSVPLFVLITVFFCEFLIYYMVIWRCSWPILACTDHTEENESFQRPLRSIILADPHLLGKNAHWLDKLRREWQMSRSFQTADFLHGPDVVFILGDVLDNGQNANMADFEEDVRRFRAIFATSARVVCAVGNHDIGFHYRIIPELRQRFEKAFSSRSVELLEISGVRFVLINSMAFEGDRCSMCREAERLLANVSLTLKCQRMLGGRENVPKECLGKNYWSETPYSKPVVLQHFPMFRSSDETCHEVDEAPADEKTARFREKWECLSKEATDKIMEAVEPRAIFGGHTHHGCYYKHENGVEEWTISSFNWRNKINPAFLMVSFCPDSLAVHKCFLPNEHTVFLVYTFSGFILVFWLVWRVGRVLRRLKVRRE